MFWTNLVIDILLVIYVIDCAFMGLVILMQRSKQEGLGAAFGSGVMGETFGAQTSQVLVKATVWAAIIFFILSIVLARLYSHQEVLAEQGSPVQQLLSKPITPAPNATSPTPAAPAPTAAPASSTAPAPVPPTPATSSAPAPVPPTPATSSAPAGK